MPCIHIHSASPLGRFPQVYTQYHYRYTGTGIELYCHGTGAVARFVTAGWA